MANRELVRNVSLLSKFKGAMVGAVIGDCIGARFEGIYDVELVDVLGLVRQIENKEVKNLTYTDDTAMTRSVAYSLIEKKKLDAVDLARRFTQEYLKEPHRGYGASVGAVFKALDESRFSDPYGPASKQFDGDGSFGNGSAMRIAPAALFGYNMGDEKLDEVVSGVSRVTHTHLDAVHGAILQCSAVARALKETVTELDRAAFLDRLSRKMLLVEQTSKKAKHPYCTKLTRIGDLITSRDDPTRDEFNRVIGTGIAAVEAVPAALYSFLRCTTPVTGLENRNNFEKTILHSISLGGDTDTIATMSGAIAGAFYGIEAIPSSWQDTCEGTGDAMEYADKLYHLSQGMCN